MRLYKKVVLHQGIRRAIVVSNQSGLIVTGHGLYQLLKELGVAKAPVDFQDFKTPADETAHLLADNRLPELADLSEVDLKLLLSELKEETLDLELAGFDLGALRGLDLEPANDFEKPRVVSNIAMPFGLGYAPQFVRRKSVATLALSLFNGEKSITGAIKEWKATGNKTITHACIQVFKTTIEETGLFPAFITTPQRHHDGFHGATAMSLGLAKSLGVPFLDLFGFSKEAKGHHPRRNISRPKLKPVKAPMGLGLILDDVATSGATMEAAISSLRSAGSRAFGMVLLHYWPD